MPVKTTKSIELDAVLLRFLKAPYESVIIYRLSKAHHLLHNMVASENSFFVTWRFVTSRGTVHLDSFCDLYTGEMVVSLEPVMVQADSIVRPVGGKASLCQFGVTWQTSFSIRTRAQD